MILKFVSGLSPKKMPTNDELAIKIALLLGDPFDMTECFECIEDKSTIIERAYYRANGVITKSQDILRIIDFFCVEPRSPKVTKCKRVCLAMFSGTSNFEFMMTIVILMKFNTCAGVRFVFECVENEENMMLNMYYVDEFPDTNAQLSYIHDILSRLDLKEIKIEGLF